MRILYIFPKYNSHYRAALAYCGLIRQWHSFVARVTESDVVFLHCEPHDYASMYRAYGLTNKYVVSCAVWEADDLPEAYKRSLAYVQEVWVPSHYCRAAFERYHPRVHVVPYVLHPPARFSDVEQSAIRQMIKYDERCVYYLTITKVWDRRKNVQFLIDAFERLADQMPRARLIIKASEHDHPARISDPRVVLVSASLPDSWVAALHECADVYVSAHHSEGWGLAIADALNFQKPTIATGYSGNLEFMNEDNSFLLKLEEDFIHVEDAFGLFTTRMKWAYPSRTDLEDKLLMLYGLREKPIVQEAVRAKLLAAADIHRFDASQVAEILRSRLEQIEDRVAASHGTPAVQAPSPASVESEPRTQAGGS
jgi:glycosyltransferase involved in cell wall biosynthesis